MFGFSTALTFQSYSFHIYRIKKKKRLIGLEIPIILYREDINTSDHKCSLCLTACVELCERKTNMLSVTETRESSQLLSLFPAKIRCSNFLAVNAVHATHMHQELTRKKTAFRISN